MCSCGEWLNWEFLSFYKRSKNYGSHFNLARNVVLGIQNNFFKTKISMKYDGVSLLGVIKGIFQHSSVKIDITFIPLD